MSRVKSNYSDATMASQQGGKPIINESTNGWDDGGGWGDDGNTNDQSGGDRVFGFDEGGNAQSSSVKPLFFVSYSSSPFFPKLTVLRRRRE